MTGAIDVNIKELKLKICCDEQHEWFWNQVNENRWEMETLQLFDENIGDDTTYIDIGTWIGPTVLYAGSKAKRVVAVEPDPVAMNALMKNLDLNPDIRDKVTLHNHALDDTDGRLDLWAYKFGDSMTSLLPSRGAHRITFLKMGVEPFLDLVLEDGDKQVFIKIDVEGGEYSLVPALCQSLRRRGVNADLYVSVHASFLVDKCRSAKSFTAALLKNAQLFSALTEYGVVYAYIAGMWQPWIKDFGKAPFFSSIGDVAGADTTLFVKAAS